jgi:hypothetical protein
VNRTDPVRAGDMVRVRDQRAGVTRWGKVLEVRGVGGAPPYLVEFGNGRTETVLPEADPFVHTRAMARREEEERERAHREWLARQPDPEPSPEA